MRLLYLAHIRLPSEKAHTFQIMRMCAAFASAGAEVTLVVPDRATPITQDPFDFYGLPCNFEIVKVKSRDALRLRWLPGPLVLAWSFFSFWRAARAWAARQKNPFQVWYTRESWLLPLLGRRGIVAYEAHDLPGRGLWWLRRGLHASNIVIATSDALRQQLVRLGFPEERTLVERNGVDIVPVPPRDRALLGLPEGVRIALYAGQLHEWKGIATLLAASRMLPPDIQIVIVGGTHEDVQRWSSRLERGLTSATPNKERVPDARVTFITQRPHAEVARYLAAADVCVVPTSGRTREAQQFTSPIKLFEYLSAGCPVVASDLPSIREIVSDDIVTLVAPDDPKALAEGICRALDASDRERRVAASRALVQQFSWDERAKRILASLTPSNPPLPACR